MTQRNGRGSSVSTNFRNFLFELSRRGVAVRGSPVTRMLRGRDPLPPLGVARLCCYTNLTRLEELESLVSELPPKYGHLIASTSPISLCSYSPRSSTSTTTERSLSSSLEQMEERGTTRLRSTSLRSSLGLGPRESAISSHTPRSTPEIPVGERRVREVGSVGVEVRYPLVRIPPTSSPTETHYVSTIFPTYDWCPPGSGIERRAEIIFQPSHVQPSRSGLLNSTCYLFEGHFQASWVCTGSLGSVLLNFDPVAIAQMEDIGVAILNRNDGPAALRYDHNYHHIHRVGGAPDVIALISIYVSGYYTRKIRLFFSQMARRGLLLRGQVVSDPIKLTCDDILTGGTTTMYSTEVRAYTVAEDAVTMAAYFAGVNVVDFHVMGSTLTWKWSIPGLTPHRLRRHIPQVEGEMELITYLPVGTTPHFTTTLYLGREAPPATSGLRWKLWKWRPGKVT